MDGQNKVVPTPEEIAKKFGIPPAKMFSSMSQSPSTPLSSSSSLQRNPVLQKPMTQVPSTPMTSQTQTQSQSQSQQATNMDTDDLSVEMIFEAGAFTNDGLLRPLQSFKRHFSLEEVDQYYCMAFNQYTQAWKTATMSKVAVEALGKILETKNINSSPYQANQYERNPQHAKIAAKALTDEEWKRWQTLKLDLSSNESLMKRYKHELESRGGKLSVPVLRMMKDDLEVARVPELVQKIEEFINYKLVFTKATEYVKRFGTLKDFDRNAPLAVIKGDVDKAMPLEEYRKMKYEQAHGPKIDSRASPVITGAVNPITFSQ